MSETQAGAPAAHGSAAPNLRAAVAGALSSAWRRAVRDGSLPAYAEPTVDVEVARPANPDHGDFATNIALRLARPLGMAPAAIATAIVDAIRSQPPIGSASVAGPGFINVRVTDEALEQVMARVLRDPAGWGRAAAKPVHHVNVEFVSANPTGPLTVGNARGAFVGDLLARVLEAGGQGVTRE